MREVMEYASLDDWIRTLSAERRIKLKLDQTSVMIDQLKKARETGEDQPDK